MKKNNNLKFWFDHFQCDKSSSHSYFVEYEKCFDSFTNNIDLLEIGIFKGASSRAFINCYGNLNYYGIDIFERENLNVVSDILNHERFKCLVADSTRNTIVDTINREWPDVSFDVIIDDGSHLHRDMMNTFKYLYPFLREGGTYYIEDFFPLTFEGLLFNNRQLKGEREYFLDRPDDFNEKTYYGLFSTIKGFKPSAVEHIDLRVNDNRTDSYIIKITK